jgi:hypothetical protein
MRPATLYTLSAGLSILVAIIVATGWAIAPLPLDQSPTQVQK